ncbi:MAG: helix-turn-helix transcriptional regulator [Clostridia bacterium]|nr:helix-turn-helix transcriptional regulator [Clostridia bacterium]
MNTVTLKSDEISIGSLSGDARSEIKHCHECYEIMYVIRGSGKYIVEGSEFLMKKRALVLSRPLTYHSVCADDSAGYESYVLHFSRNALSDDAILMLDRLISSEENGRYFAPDAVSESLISTFDRFESAASLPAPEMKAYIRALLSEIIILLSAASGEKMTFTDDELGARVIRYLNNNIEKNVSLEKLARRFFVSKYHLCRAFKKYSGISVHSYINHKRIMYAKQLIASGETAQSAAYKVGFGDYSAFYRAYVKIVGKSPRAEHTREEPDEL